MAKPDRSIVFVGNAQSNALAQLCWIVGADDQRPNIHYIGSDQLRASDKQTLLNGADVLVVQDDGSDLELLQAVISDPRSVIFPGVEADFLWPYADEPPFYHYAVPGAPSAYPPHLGDALLNRCLRSRLSGPASLERYEEASRLQPARLNDAREWRFELQRRLDLRHGYDLSSFIHSRLARQPLFRTRFHWQPALLAAVASRLLPRLGLDKRTVEAALALCDENEFPRDEMPIHPRVARHFALQWVRPETRYRFGAEGLVTFEEFVRRYVGYQSNHRLRVGCGWSWDGEASVALALLEDGLRQTPEAAEGWYAKGVVMMRLGRLDDAVRALDQAVAIEPDEGDYWTELARACLAQHRTIEAGAAARRGSLCARGARRAAILAADLVSDADDPQSVFLILSRAALFKPEDAELLRRKGFAALRASLFDPAATTGEELLILFPEDAHVRNLLAEALEGKGERDRAIHELTKGLDDGVFNDQTYSLLGHFNLRKGRLAEAEAAFLAGQRIAPERAEFGQCIEDVRALRHVAS